MTSGLRMTRLTNETSVYEIDNASVRLAKKYESIKWKAIEMWAALVTIWKMAEGGHFVTLDWAKKKSNLIEAGGCGAAEEEEEEEEGGCPIRWRWWPERDVTAFVSNITKKANCSESASLMIEKKRAGREEKWRPTNWHLNNSYHWQLNCWWEMNYFVDLLQRWWPHLTTTRQSKMVRVEWTLAAIVYVDFVYNAQSKVTEPAARFDFSFSTLWGNGWWNGNVVLFIIEAALTRSQEDVLATSNDLFFMFWASIHSFIYWLDLLRTIRNLGRYSIYLWGCSTESNQLFGLVGLK